MAQAISNLAVGSKVKLKVNGTDYAFIVVNQGIPSSSSLYDSSCDGTWLLMEDIYEKREWHSSLVNDYENSTIHSYLNSTFLGLLDANIQSAIKQVKIPYQKGTGSGGSIASGSSGLSTKIFLLSGYELGWTTSSNQYFPVDGAKLDYFLTATYELRKGYYNGTVTSWNLRSPTTSNTTYAWYVNTGGNYSGGYTSVKLGVRPAFVLNSRCTVSDTTDSDGCYTGLTPPPDPTLYAGDTNGIAQKVKKLYYGVNGIAQKVKKLYVGDENGIAQLVYSLQWPGDLDTGLEFVSASPFTISVTTPSWDGTMEYCNGDEWQTWDGSEISSGEAKSGQCLYIRGTGNTKVAGGTIYKFTLTGNAIECNGNIENLLDYVTVKAGEHPTMADYCYGSMFYGCTSLTTAPSLPATTLAGGCYNCMFYGCTSLTTAPSLPATTLASDCYNCMFYGCTSLTTAPSLPATTLASGCYSSMFSRCTSLTAAPSLPATTLAGSCYNFMFYKCTSLTTVPSLPATTLTGGCYGSMFGGCTSIKLSSTKTGTYTRAYRIPRSGTGKTATGALLNMFVSTGGTFTGTPNINTTYYLDSSNTIV